jgi:hypothetical protein
LRKSTISPTDPDDAADPPPTSLMALTHAPIFAFAPRNAPGTGMSIHSRQVIEVLVARPGSPPR